MKEIVISIFGNYVAPTFEVMYGSGEETVILDAIPAGAAGIDWEWLAGVILFCIVLNGLMRIIHGVLNQR